MTVRQPSLPTGTTGTTKHRTSRCTSQPTAKHRRARASARPVCPAGGLPATRAACLFQNPARGCSSARLMRPSRSQKTRLRKTNESWSTYGTGRTRTYSLCSCCSALRRRTAPTRRFWTCRVGASSSSLPRASLLSPWPTGATGQSRSGPATSSTASSFPGMDATRTPT